MKHMFPLTGILVLMVVFLGINNSCSKHSNSNNNNGMTNQPAAQAAFDNQSGGVYKGSLTGSSGYFEVNLQGSRAFIIYQWTTPAESIDSLFTNSLTNWQSGQAISKAVFTATDGSVFWFSVGTNGANPSIDSVYIPGHTTPIYASIGKELSNSLVRVYQGTAIGSGTGTHCTNSIVGLWTAGAGAAGYYLDTDGENGTGVGTISGNQIQVVFGNAAGTLMISGDYNTITGTVVDNKNNNGNNCSHALTMTRVL